MNISRKEFFRQGFYSLGDALFKAGDTVREVQESLLRIPLEEEQDSMPEPDAGKVAMPENRNCLARNSGCFSCVERCESQAITVAMGEGIKVDQDLCVGCGTCQYICPVTPKAVMLQKR